MFRFTIPAVALAFASLASIAEAQINVYVSTPGVQRINDGANPFDYSGFRVENFNGFALATPWTGTGGNASGNGGVYTTSGPANIVSGDQYGGEVPAANPERYLAIRNPDGAVTISFDAPASYFGMFWTAGNATNQIALYGGIDGDLHLGTFDTGTLLDLFGTNTSPKTVETLGGTSVSGGAFYGQPGSGSTGHQPFAFLHFISPELDFGITRIVLTNTEPNSAFESDNHTTAFWGDGGLVLVPEDSDELIEITTVVPVPEPSTYALLATGVAFGYWMRRRRRLAA